MERDCAGFRSGIIADYFQLYVQDVATTEDFAEGWTDQTVKAMFVAKTTAIAIGTARDMDVPLRLEIHAVEPADASDWDRQNAAVLSLPSGRLQVLGCIEYGPDAFVTELTPGQYHVRVSYFDLDTLSEDGLDGNDRYLVQLWPVQ